MLLVSLQIVGPILRHADQGVYNLDLCHKYSLAGTLSSLRRSYLDHHTMPRHARDRLRTIFRGLEVTIQWRKKIPQLISNWLGFLDCASADCSQANLTVALLFFQSFYNHWRRRIVGISNTIRECAMESLTGKCRRVDALSMSAMQRSK